MNGDHAVSNIKLELEEQENGEFGITGYRLLDEKFDLQEHEKVASPFVIKSEIEFVDVTEAFYNNQIEENNQEVSHNYNSLDVNLQESINEEDLSETKTEMEDDVDQKTSRTTQRPHAETCGEVICSSKPLSLQPVQTLQDFDTAGLTKGKSLRIVIHKLKTFLNNTRETKKIFPIIHDERLQRKRSILKDCSENGIQGGITKRKSNSELPRNNMKCLRNITARLSCKQVKRTKCRPRKQFTDSEVLCDICNKTFSKPYSLKRHMAIHSKRTKYRQVENGIQGEITKRKSNTELPRNNVKHFEDPTDRLSCKEVISTKCRPKEHFTDADVLCDICNQTFSKPSNLKRHMATHSTKFYNCDKCDFKSLHMCNLKRHAIIHLKKYPYKCNVCGYKCVQSFSLKRHMRCRHTKVNKFKCEECGYLCDRKDSLKYHMINNHISG